MIYKICGYVEVEIEADSTDEAWVAFQDYYIDEVIEQLSCEETE